MAATIFTGVREGWLPLYTRLRDMAIAVLGPFDEHVTASAVLWKHSSTFAEIGAKKSCMVVGFASDKLHDEWQPSKVIITSKNRVAHYFEVTDDALFPVLMERIAAAYALTQSNKPRKAPAKLPQYTTVDEYIALFGPDVRQILEQIRRTVKEAAPDAEERISWQMPTYWQQENLVHFAAHKSHIGFYPGESGIRAFADKLSGYKASRGAVQFPLSQPMPYRLIAEITRFRVKEIMERAGR